MWNGMNSMMMDPELMRMVQEQMSRMSPQEMARIQQQMLSNPDLMKFATESMKNMRPEDIRNATEQLKHTRAEDMAEIGEKMAKSSPEELAAMRAQAEAQVSYELSAAQMLKQQGNDLHSRAKYREAALKYLHAKNNLMAIPVLNSQCRTLQLQCSLNLMSCYLKTRQLEECIKEGSEVLTYDSKNVKALYRRGQAYKEMGNLKAAVSDLSKAHEASPEDETIADVLRDANEKLSKEGARIMSGGVVIEEIVEEEEQTVLSKSRSSSLNISASPSPEIRIHDAHVQQNGGLTADVESLQHLKDDPESIRLFQHDISNANPESFAAMGAGGMPPEMIKTATDMISKMKPDELQNMLQTASSLKEKDLDISATATTKGVNAPKLGSGFPEMTPEMVNMASERISKMSPEELQKMVKVASSLNLNGSPFSTTTSRASTERSQTDSPPPVTAAESSSRGNSSGNSFSNPGIASSMSRHSNATTGLQENVRNTIADPAMHQMFMYMMKNMNPEMMANMSEQFGMKLSKEDAVKAQQAMSSLSPDELENMMRWADRAQRGIETAWKTKNWLLGKPGMILAICMLILAFVFHKLGFIGG